MVDTKNFRCFTKAWNLFKNFTQMRFLQFFQRNQRSDLWQVLAVDALQPVLTAQFGEKCSGPSWSYLGQYDRPFDGTRTPQNG